MLGRTPAALVGESADLLYHLLVLWAAAGVSPGGCRRRAGAPRGHLRDRGEARAGKPLSRGVMAYDRNNVFARILRGEIPCKKVYEDEHVLAFEDINPREPDACSGDPQRGIRLARRVFARKAPADQIAALVRALGQIAREREVAESGYRVLAKAGPPRIRKFRIFTCTSSVAATSAECCRGADRQARPGDRVPEVRMGQALLVSARVLLTKIAERSDPAAARSVHWRRRTRPGQWRSAASGGRGGATGAETGRVASPSPFPCRTGKKRVKIFWGSRRGEKSRAIIDLCTTRGKNRRHGREAAKPSPAVWHRPDHCQYTD